MKDWAVGMRRTYDWSGEGRSSQEAVWWQLLRAEGLEDNDGPEAEGLVTILLDVVKCFDRVELRHVWRWGTQHGMPTRLLRMVLVTYSLARRIAFLGSLSDPTSTRTAVVPGSAFAIFVLHAVLVTPCDDLLRAHQRHGLQSNLRIAKYVDDIAVSVQGKCSDVQEMAINAFDWMECRLRLDLGLELSLASGVGRSARDGKSVVIASNEWLRAKMQSRSRARGLRVVAAARNLGIQQKGSGVRSSTDVREARIRAVEARRSRMTYAKKLGASVHKVAKLGLKPSATFGQRALGMFPRQRHRLRRMINASLPGTHFGRSLTLRLAIADAETLHESRADPINAWAAATWHTQGELVMADAWLRQNVAAAANGAWNRVVGPASTIVAMIKEIQWTWPAWHTFRSREGLMMDMRTTCPRDVTAMALMDSKRVALEAWVAGDPARAELHPVPLLEPLVRWFRARRGMGNAAAAAQAVTGGHWTQALAHERGLVDHPYCMACLSIGVEAAGTARHRLCDCKATRLVRAAMAPDLQHRMTAGDTRMLWERALVADPSARHRYRPQVDAETWWLKPGCEHTRFTGKVASDGSRIGNWENISPTGFGVAMVDDNEGDAVLTVSGPMPHQLPVQRRIARAELHGVLVMLRNANAPATLFVDCKLIIDGLAKGRTWCTAARRQHADVWRDIWDRLDDLGTGVSGIDIKKVKAHQAAGDRARATGDKIAYLANHHADALAKRGAATGTNIFLGYVQTAVNEAAETVTGMLTYMDTLASATAAASIARDVEVIPRRVTSAPRAKAKPSERPLHRVICIEDGFKCLVCHKKAAKRGNFFKESCEGVNAARLPLDLHERYAFSSGHRIWLTGPYAWCSICGCHSMRRLKGLAEPCGARRTQEVAKKNLANGKCPTARAADRAIYKPKRLTTTEWAQWREAPP
jgi:hypothetical protein